MAIESCNHVLRLCYFETFSTLTPLGLFITLVIILVVSQATGLRCYMDSSDPNHPGVEECLQVDGQGDGRYLIFQYTHIFQLCLGRKITIPYYPNSYHCF